MEPLAVANARNKLRGLGWTPTLITQLGDVLAEFSDVFSKSPNDYGSCSLPTFKITVPPNISPVTSRPYRMNAPTTKYMNTVYDKFPAASLIQHSTSLWASPVMVIPENSGDIRITVNYKKLKKTAPLASFPSLASMRLSTNVAPVEYFHSSTSSLLSTR